MNNRKSQTRFSMQCLKKMIAMTKVLTPKEVQKTQHWKPTTWRRRREACLVSPYKDAIVLESMRKCHVKEDRFEEFLDWQSRQVYNEMFGVNDE